MSEPSGKSEVVRYIAKEPKGWITRGTLLRVIARAKNGKIRVASATNHSTGAPQFLEEADVEPVGIFKNSDIFGGAIECGLPDEQEGQASAEEVAEAVEAFEDALAKFEAGELDVEKPTPDIDLRQLVRDEIVRSVRETVSRMVREEVARVFML